VLETHRAAIILLQLRGRELVERKEDRMSESIDIDGPYSPSALPPLPLEDWRDTKETLHRYVQIVGKVRLEYSPFRNHWWHVTLHVDPRGLSARHMFSGELAFEISLDLIAHELKVVTGAGDRASFPLRDGLFVAEFYSKLVSIFETLGIEVDLSNPSPFDLEDEDRHFEEDTEHASYDEEYVERYQRILTWVDHIFQEFSGRFNGKQSPVHLFWHGFDLAVTRFSGRRAPEREGADKVTREAYSHEVISFGFWPGDRNTPAPAFYSYTAPEPDGLTGQTLRPESAFWAAEGGMALLMYDDVRKANSPRTTLLEFMESAYQAGARTAGWDMEDLQAEPRQRAGRAPGEAGHSPAAGHRQEDRGPAGLPGVAGKRARGGEDGENTDPQ
jgi:hypothetical protein